MDKDKIAKTYAGCGHHPPKASSKHVADLFDQIIRAPQPPKRKQPFAGKAVEDVFGSMTHGESVQEEGGKSIWADTTKEQQSKRSLDTDTGWHSHQDSRRFSPGLFRDTFESSPQKTKKQKKTRKADQRKKQDVRENMEKIAVSVALSVPKSVSPEKRTISMSSSGKASECNTEEAEKCMANKSEDFMNEIETMRRTTADYAPKWTFADKKPVVERRPSLSLSVSMEDHFDESGGSTSNTSRTPILQSWSPAGARKRSFFKIRTPGKMPGKPRVIQLPEPLLSLDLSSPNLGKVGLGQQLSDGGQGTGSESYTTVYTWTTAAGTATNTPMQTQTDLYTNKPVAQKSDRSAPTSTTLVLKCVDQEQLHSTAIFPHDEHGHLNRTPQVSPIRENPDSLHGVTTNSTPATTTAKVSPRGPRKTHSFSGARERKGHPKCSTMLFTSSVADAGDAPLDISTIRDSLSEALDLNKDSRTDQGNQVERHGDVKRAGILTSTPRGHGYRKFSFDLSSVCEPSQEEELYPLQQSGRLVNSQEIVADTLLGVSPKTALQVFHDVGNDDHNAIQKTVGNKSDGQESGVILEGTPRIFTRPGKDTQAWKNKFLGKENDSTSFLVRTSRSNQKPKLTAAKNERPVTGEKEVSCKSEEMSSPDSNMYIMGDIIPKCFSSSEYSTQNEKHKSFGKSKNKGATCKNDFSYAPCEYQRDMEKGDGQYTGLVNSIVHTATSAVYSTSGSMGKGVNKKGILDADLFEPCSIGLACRKSSDVLGKEKQQTPMKRPPLSPFDSGYSGRFDLSDIPPDDIAVLSLRVSKQLKY